MEELKRGKKTDGLIKTNPKDDLTGKTFNKLTVIERGPDLIYGKRRAAWYCLCSCGNPNKLLIMGSDLRSGHIKSCGCIIKDRYKDNNRYDLSDDHIGRCRLNSGEEFIFDLEDYDSIKSYCWHTNAKGYVMTSVYDDRNTKNKMKSMFLHRYIMGVHNLPWQDYVVDHINGNVKDNRKSNLRIVTQSENGMNSKLSINNSSGVPGVCKQNGTDRWIAYIKFKTEQIYLGIYNSFEDAVKVRKAAEEKYFGEYSYDNSQQRGDSSAENY